MKHSLSESLIITLFADDLNESISRPAVTVNSSNCLSVNEVPNAADGKLVQIEQGKKITSIRMDKLIRGTYFVECIFENGETLKNKIIKN